jgi:hypothetical protein
MPRLSVLQEPFGFARCPCYFLRISIFLGYTLQSTKPQHGAALFLQFIFCDEGRMVHLRPDGDFQCTPAAHLVQCGLVVVKFENIRHHSFDIDLSAVKVCHRAREAEGLRERPNDLIQGSEYDFIASGE